jgi:transcriptional regulator with XRE-family HTH domain
MGQKDELLQKFGRHLTALREKKMMTIEELAAATGLTAHQLRQIEAGKVNILFSTVIVLSRGLHITPAELLQPLDPD